MHDSGQKTKERSMHNSETKVRELILPYEHENSPEEKKFEALNLGNQQ